MQTLYPLDLEKALAEKALCVTCDGSGEIDHECDCKFCRAEYEDCKTCRGSGKATGDYAGYPRELDSDDESPGPELEPYCERGWLIKVRDDNGTHFATAERHHDGVHQFVQERAVYLADLVERIAAAMDGAAT